jgi:hypothetical protein
MTGEGSVVQQVIGLDSRLRGNDGRVVGGAAGYWVGFPPARELRIGASDILAGPFNLSFRPQRSAEPESSTHRDNTGFPLRGNDGMVMNSFSF